MLTETNEAIQGQRQSWNLIKKLGEGDAGEVYLVESLLDHQPAICKRPRKSTFFSDSLRQASQIKKEGTILRGLSKINQPEQVLQVHFPVLIDQNRREVEPGDKTFIIVSQAKGLDMKMLSQVIRFGNASIEERFTEPEYTAILQQWSQFNEFPAQILVRVLLGVLNLLEDIHNAKILNDAGTHSGVIWNDVKPEHLYWDPVKASLTVIDWGNSQFLERDNISKDRQYSAIDDFRQFIQEIGSFISDVNAELYSSLEWPQISANVDIYENAIQPMKEKLEALYQTDAEHLRSIRQQEADLYGLARPEAQHIKQFETLRLQLAAHGELPDQLGANNFLIKAAYKTAAEYHLADLQHVCDCGANLATTAAARWKLLSEITQVAIKTEDIDEPTQAAFSNALMAGVTDDWTAALWQLFIYLGTDRRPDWWEKISNAVRKVYLGLDQEAIAPYTSFARLYYTLQSEATQKGNQRLQDGSAPENNNDQPSRAFHWQGSQQLIAKVREEIIEKWKEIEPSPPNSGIAYSAVDNLIDPIEQLLEGSRELIERELKQPKAQAALVLNAWEKKDFELARRGLRSLLMWDPDRARLFTAERAIEAAPQWLARVHRGTSKDEPFYDFLTSVELAGRTLRNQVGPARWLDETLEALKRLRKGTRSVDLMMEYPEIMHELPWLNEYQRREILSLPHTHPIGLERDKVGKPGSTDSHGVEEGRFGPQQTMRFEEALDTWIPEARGSSARVFAGSLSAGENQPLMYAFKIMRPDQVAYALPLFIEEIQVLNILRDVPGITPYAECGFIKLGEGQALPDDGSHASAKNLSGDVIHYGVEQTQNFLATMDRQITLGWLPYLALEKRNPDYNFIKYCDASYTHGWFLALKDSLILALQICDILQFAHDRNIVYRDHKILHYYWDAEAHGAAIIDWNIAKRQPQGLLDAEKQFDLVQFGARGLHHIFSGRPAQGSLPLGPNRPEDIENASTHYAVNWTYDDERLPNQLRAILEKTLNQGYTQVRDLRQDLLEIYQQLPETEKK
jgi:serine/threonine protein kinase